MPRKQVPLVTDEKYHICNRGVDKRVIFVSKEDYLRFYRSMYVFNAITPTHNFETAKNRVIDDDKKLVKVIAYALLPNHFHIILEQVTDGGISEFMKRLQGGYTTYFNERYERSGSLLQGKFKRLFIDTDEYYRYLFAYVNENHTVHGVTLPEEDICYTSSLHYQGRFQSKILPTSLEAYDQREQKAVAQQIAKRREITVTER